MAQITGQVSSWWQAYTRRLEVDPVRTKAVTSFLGFMIGDFLAQRIGGEVFSPLRYRQNQSVGSTGLARLRSSF